MFAVNVEKTDHQFGLVRVENWKKWGILDIDYKTEVVKQDKNVIYKYGLVKL